MTGHPQSLAPAPSLPAHSEPARPENWLHLSRWMPTWLGDCRVGVIGAARSGLAAARVFGRFGARVLLSDSGAAATVEPRIAAAGLPPGVEVETGGHTERLLATDLLVLSPGVPRTMPMVVRAIQRGIPVLAEIEVAYRLSRGRRLVVTGSNGKTTTTTLLAELIRTSFPHTFLGGNIGLPVLDFACDCQDDSVQVLEVSSFQLESIDHFRPDIGLITNFYPNHLDRYPDYEAYIEAKAVLARKAEATDWMVLNAAQPRMHALAATLSCQVAWFGGREAPGRPWYAACDGVIGKRDQNDIWVPLVPGQAVRIPGAHNLENVTAAVAMADLAGVATARLAPAVEAFRGVEHRIEFVRDLDGVAFYNDSKATNCAASITAIAAIPGPIVLIAGGRDKGTDLDDWIAAIERSVRHVVLVGEATARFQPALAGRVPVSCAASFADGVGLAARLARPGDTVLLSPACASYDQFADYEERGRVFKTLVHALTPSGSRP